MGRATSPSGRMDGINARVQRFDMTGKYLGEWDNLGRVTGVTFRGGNLWIGTQFNNERMRPTGGT